MTSRLQIRHVSRYEYANPVAASFNEVRLTPLALPWQNCLESLLFVETSNGAGATWQWAFSDYWGTWVRAFEVADAHSSLTVETLSLVEVDNTQRPVAKLDMPWDEVRTETNYQYFGEFLTQTERTAPSDDLLAAVEQLVVGLSPQAAALAVCQMVRSRVTYKPGSTGVNTSARESWEAGVGVCQDYVHIIIGALRHLGLPARYVSGYLHPAPDAPFGQTVTGESHAWVEWWLGEWTGFDPANDSPIGEMHVLVGTGRDYTDVPPVKGVVAGSSDSTLTVTVELIRLA